MRLLIIILLTAASSTLFSQQNAYLTTADSDLEAIRTLEKMETILAEYKSIQAECTMTTSIPGEDAVTTKIQFRQQGEKYVIDAGEYLIKSDAHLRWVYLTESNEVNIYDAGDPDETLTPLDYIQLYKNGEYVSALINPHQIEFKPIDKYSDYSKLRLTLLDSALPMRFEIFEKSGVRINLEFDTITDGTPQPEEFFVFNPADYPGVHVEDLRIE